MNTLVRFALDARTKILTCCAIVALVSACSGGSASSPAPQQPQLAASEQAVNLPGPPPPDAVSMPAARPDQIAALYWWLLGRQPDAAGLQFWQQTGMPVDQIANALEASAEMTTAHAWENIGANTRTHIWVDASATGSREDGSEDHPYRTLAAAAKAVKSASTTVFVKPGTYTGGFATSANGSAGNVGGYDGTIYWVSTLRWGARIVPPPTGTRVSDHTTAWTNTGDYVQIAGFEVDGSLSANGAYDNWREGIFTGGKHSLVRDNYVHDIARWYSCKDGRGGAGIDLDASTRGGQADAVGNWVRDVGQPGAGCNRFQGIYASSSGSVVNNVVYRAYMGAAIHLYHEATAVKVINNTVAASNVGIVVGTGEYRGAAVEHKDSLIYNNIAYDNNIGIQEWVGRGGIMGINYYKNNLVTQNRRDWDGMINAVTGTQLADPAFVAYAKTQLLPNFHLAATSGAIGKGTTSNAHQADFDGRPRAPDGSCIGAYEAGR
ncbi:MAG: hypothetical protein ACXWC4_19240 [Telluria sp.]